MSKRALTETEIENILEQIQPQKGIPVPTAMAIVEKIRGKIRKQMEGQEIYPKMIPELRRCILMMYENARVQPGESVGTIAAQSFGQFQTQSTLNSFHKAGLAEKTVVSGVPRFAELIGATKSPKGRACIIKFNSENDSIQSLRKMIDSSILEFKVKKLSDSITMHMKKEPEPWYESFKILHHHDFENMNTCVTIIFNKKYLYEHSITLKKIAEKIESVYSDLICVFSPNHLCQMDIFVDTEAIELPDNISSFITEDNMVQVYVEEVVIPKLEELHVFGIIGIANIFYCNETDPKTKVDTWYLESEGSNFSDLLAHPNVDIKNTITNDIWEIYNTLGIEATRQYLIEEFGMIMSGINPCHSRLLADKMTYNGIITSISRYAMRAEGSGALSKASFEETLDNLLNAAVYGERECTDGVSASIICGKLGKFGTGVCELKIDMSKLTGVVFKGEVKEK